MNEETSKHSRKIIVVEDNARDMEYLTTSLSSFSLLTSSRGDEALELFREHPDAYVISDLQLPGLNGIELAANIWEITKNAHVVIWSQYNDEVYLRSLAQVIPPDALYGYVLKNNPSNILKKAVNSVFLNDECWLDPQLQPIQARSENKHSVISDAEFEVLIDIALGMTDQLISERRFLSKRGVQSRLNSLYAKLGVDQISLSQGINPRSRAVGIALSRGLINQHELGKAEQAFVNWQNHLKES